MDGWIIVILKSVALLVLLFFMTKALGKRQLAQLTIFEYITGIVLGGIVAIHTSTMKYSFYHGIIAMLIWFIIPLLVDFVSLKSKKFRDFFQGKSTVFIKNGKVLENNLKKEGFTAEELLEHLRYKSIFNVDDVEFALLEPSGIINIQPKKDTLPPTRKDLNLPTTTTTSPETVIIDGEVIFSGLANNSLSVEWLKKEIDQMNLGIGDIFLAQVDDNGELSIDLYDDAVLDFHEGDSELLIAQLEKCQADLNLFALSKADKISKQIFIKSSKKLQQVETIISSHKTK